MWVVFFIILTTFPMQRCWQLEPPAVVLGAVQFVSWNACGGTQPAENLPAERWRQKMDQLRSVVKLYLVAVVGKCVHNSFYRFCVSGRCWSTLLALLWRWWVFLRSARGGLLPGLECCLEFSLDDHRRSSYGFSCNMVQHDTTYFIYFHRF